MDAFQFDVGGEGPGAPRASGGPHDGGRLRATVRRHEATIQTLQARVEDLEAELRTMEQTVGRRENHHQAVADRLRQRLAVYEPDAAGPPSLLADDVHALRQALQDKVAAIEQQTEERVRLAVLEARVHARPALRTLAERREDTARQASDEVRADCIQRLADEAAGLRQQLDAAQRRNAELLRDAGDLRNMIAVLRGDLKRSLQEQVAVQRGAAFAGLSLPSRAAAPAATAPPAPPAPPAALDTTQVLHTPDLPSPREGTPGTPGDGSAPGSIVRTGSPSPPGRRASGRGESPAGRSAYRLQLEARTLRQRVSVLLGTVDSLNADIASVASGVVAAVREAGMADMLCDAGSTLSEAERIRLCGHIAANPGLLQGLLRLAQASMASPRGRQAGPAPHRRLPLLSTELDTRALCGLDSNFLTKYRPVQTLPGGSLDGSDLGAGLPVGGDSAGGDDANGENSRGEAVPGKQ